MGENQLLIHLHGFKCAGTTFAAILERNYPKQVLYVESLMPNQRLKFEQVLPLLAVKQYQAISSHLLAIPNQTDFDKSNFTNSNNDNTEKDYTNNLVIVLLRDPKLRLISAYEFQKATNTLKPGDVNFRAFLNRLRNSAVANYQTRLLSNQSWSGAGQRKGWDLDPWSIDLASPNLFVGTVELFDQSMVLLENWLATKGIAFDASYRSVRNSKKSTDLDQIAAQQDLIWPDMVEIDQVLWNQVTSLTKQQIAADPNFAKRLTDHTARGIKLIDEPIELGAESVIRL